MRDVEDGLVVRIRVDRGHQAELDAERGVKHLRDGREAVRGARAVREQVMFRAVVELVVDAHDDGEVVVLRGRRDDDLLRAGVEVRLALLLVGEEARALEHDVDAELFPRELRGVLFCEDLDVFPCEGKLAFACRGLRLGAAVDRVVVVKVSERGWIREVVDGDELEIRDFALLKRADDAAADSSETVDGDLLRHGDTSSFSRAGR